jgi:hypothetical protein
MTQASQHEIYLPHWYYTPKERTNNLRIVPLGWHRRMAWWHCCCGSPTHNEPWLEKIDSLAESPKCVDTLFDRSVNTRELQRGRPVSHILARPHSLSLIDLKRSLKFLRKLEYPVYQTRWSSFGRFSLRRRRTSATEIVPTSTQAASGWGKARTMANLGASSGRDE